MRIESPDLEPPEIGTKTVCHMVSAGYAAGTDQWTVVCPTLPESILDIVREMSEPTGNERNMATRIGWIVEQFKLPGITLIWNPTPFPPPADHVDPLNRVGYLDPPPSWTLQMEPTELIEGEPTLTAIIAGHEDPYRPPRQHRPPIRLRWSARRILLVVICAALLLFLIPCALLSLQTRSNFPCFGLPAVGVIVLLLLGLLETHQTGGQWWIVHGAVILRRFSCWSGSACLQRFTPADSVLLIHPQPPGWRAIIYQRRSGIRRQLSYHECVALLRIWQSPLSPPDLETLEDLR